MNKEFFLKLFLLVTIVGSIVGCSPRSTKDESVQLHNPRLIHGNSTSCFPSLEEQDELVREFAYACENMSFVEYLFHEGQTEYSLFTFKDTYEPEGFEEMLNVDSLTDYHYSYLTELVHNYCTNYYLRFNIVIPFPYNFMNSIADNNVYVVNALYRQALGNTSSIGEYKVSYVNSTPVSNVTIDETFCQTHMVIVLTFRDCITGWQHFNKGEQSISDWLIKTSVSYLGYGCMNYNEFVNELSPNPNPIIFPILHSKKIFRRPCSEKYDHFCKLGKPEYVSVYMDGTVLITETLDQMGADPYITSWSELIEGVSNQYIPVTENTFGIDLYGHDFFISDTTLIMENGRHIYVPEQICEFDSSMNAQRFVVEWQ